MATETPAALSVAPVPLCQESMWPPSMTTSSFRSVPGISATVLKVSTSSWNSTARSSAILSVSPWRIIRSRRL